MKQEKMIDGVRHVLNPKTEEYLPDTEILKGWTYVLDEENFRYYPIYLREVPIDQISDQERKEFLEMVAESERQSAEEKEILGIHGSGVRHSTGRNERELLQDGIGVLETNSGGTS